MLLPFKLIIDNYTKKLRLHWQSCHLGGSHLFMKYDVFRQNAEFFLGIELISFKTQSDQIYTKTYFQNFLW